MAKKKAKRTGKKSNPRSVSFSLTTAVRPVASTPTRTGRWFSGISARTFFMDAIASWQCGQL